MPSASFGSGLPPAAPMCAGAIDQDVDPPELGFDLFLHLRDRRLVANVAADRRDSSAVSRDLLRDRVEVCRLAILCGPGPGQVMDRDIRAKLGQTIRHHAAEPPRPEPVTNAILPGELFGHALSLQS